MLIFIDTNIFLSFYHFSNDDLEELAKLSVLLEKDEVVLYLPEQIIHEFQRNRDNKIADALKQFSAQKLDFRFPQFLKEYEEFENLRELQRYYSKVHAKLYEKAIEDIQARNLKADKVIQDLFDKGLIWKIDDEVLELARTRIEVGNPPGKKGSLGDALNWEVLLRIFPGEDDLYFISDDKDYFSQINSNLFNPFLLQEWQSKKGSKIICYKSLSGFFKDHFPTITLASEIEKDLRIQQLANSSSFTKTHSIISKLNNYPEFTIAQVNALVDGGSVNSQVYWIINDLDVKSFFQKIIKGKEAEIKPESLAGLFSYLEETTTSNEDPFEGVF